MRVDDIESAPVPRLHVHLPRAVLMVTGNDEPTSFATNLTGEINWLLQARGLNHASATQASRNLLHLVNCPLELVHGNDFLRTHLLRHGTGEWPTTKRDHTGSSFCGQANE